MSAIGTKQTALSVSQNVTRIRSDTENPKSVVERGQGTVRDELNIRREGRGFQSAGSDKIVCRLSGSAGTRWLVPSRAPGVAKMKVGVDCS